MQRAVTVSYTVRNVLSGKIWKQKGSHTYLLVPCVG